jgi:hypothetical protein
MSNQIAVLQRIAAFAAGARGHRLGSWRFTRRSATTGCVHCGQGLTVRCSPIQPDMHGDALATDCRTAAHPVAA